jgi:hypothetical protein
MARGLAQHGGLPVWLEESDPADVIFYVMDKLYCLPFPYRTAAQLLADRNFQLMLYSKCTQLSVMSYVTQGTHGLVL